MTTCPSDIPYVLGSADAEHERLIRQGARLAPFTERLFRDAGIGPGQRVLDIGSGVGDVALVAARLVGPSGRIVGVDRDGGALAKARARVAAAGIEHVQFIEADVAEVHAEMLFDAVVGRYILMFLADPVATLRTLAARVRPGGVLVFQEPSWASFLPHTAHLALRSTCAMLICETLRRSGARPDMALVLFRGFQEIGFPMPELRLEIPVAHDRDARLWIYDLLCTVRPRFQELGLSDESLGDFATLSDRLEDELHATGSYAAGVGLVGAWSRKPHA